MAIPWFVPSFVLLIAIPVFGQATGSPPQHSTSADEQAVVQLVRDVTNAFVRGDRTFLERVLAPDFVGVNQRSQVNNREQVLEHLHPPLPGVTATVIDSRVQQRGDVAVTRSTARFELPLPGGKKSEFFTFTSDTFVREGGEWRLIASHTSAIPKWTARPMDDSDLQPLVPKECSAEAQLRSQDATTQAFLRFRNESSAPVTRYWIDYEGKRREKSVLKPGASDDVRTFLTHPLVVEDVHGKCLGLYMPANEPSLVILR